MIFKAKKKDKFAAWLEKNQGGSFTQFYAESVLDALSGKRKHASLGPTLVEGSEDHARKRFDELVAQGIKPSDTVVDYGCGTLRLGVHFIDYLDAGRYIIDIDDRIIAAGRDHLPADLLEAKRPVLEVISPESLARAATRRPQWIFSNGVLPHVPPEHLNAYFTNLALRAWRRDRDLQRKGARQARKALVQELDARWSSRATGGRGLRHAADLPAPGPVETTSAHKLLILLASITAAWRANGRGVLPAPRMSKNRHERPQAQ
jgi:hypothetical protein